MPIIIPDNLPYSPRSIECLRFGARRGGEGIGCCAVDIIQGFGNHPDAEAQPTPRFDGDTWAPIMKYPSGKQLHMVGTNEQVFLAYLAHGSFTEAPVNDHAFIAVMSDEQANDSYSGQAWLRILHREGFRYIDTVNNGVYSEYHPNHIFMLIRNTTENLSNEDRENLGPPALWKELISQGEKTPQEIEERYQTLWKICGDAHEYR